MCNRCRNIWTLEWGVLYSRCGIVRVGMCKGWSKTCPMYTGMVKLNVDQRSSSISSLMKLLLHGRTHDAAIVFLLAIGLNLQLDWRRVLNYYCKRFYQNCHHLLVM
jgi:hypothetical protein